MRIISRNVEETIELGRRLGALLPRGACVAVHGELGAGKTQFVRGIALGAEVADIGLVSSPTFVLLNIYPADSERAQPSGALGSKTVYHLDAYRVRGAEDFGAVGLEELLRDDGIVVIEWAERIADLLPTDHLCVRMEAEDETVRQIELVGMGEASARVIEALTEA